jgi:hypothetical protein
MQVAGHSSKAWQSVAVLYSNMEVRVAMSEEAFTRRFTANGLVPVSESISELPVSISTSSLASTSFCTATLSSSHTHVCISQVILVSQFSAFSVFEPATALSTLAPLPSRLRVHLPALHH